MPWFFGLVADGKVDGLRIDHPDGLYDPATYFRRLQDHYLLAAHDRLFDADRRVHRAVDWNDVERALRDRLAARDMPAGDQVGAGPPLYVVIEKILGSRETLVESLAGPRHQRL